MKSLLKSFAACAAMCGFAAEGFGLTAADYVQKGLIGHYDGIDNAGTGTHDATATDWKDLTGETGDFSLSSAAWSGGNGLKKTAYGYIARRGDRKEGVAMYEAVVSGIPSLGWVVPVFISSGQNLSFSDNATGGYRSFFLDYSHFGQKTTAKPSPAFLVVAHGSSGAEHLWQNGIELTGNSYKNYWGDVSGMAFGGRPGGSGSELSITGYTVHAVRFYSRVLTDEELGQNYAIDRVRFFGLGGFTVDKIQTQAIPEGGRAEPSVTVRDIVTGEAISSDNYEVSYLNNDVAGGPDAAVAVVTGKAGTDYEGMAFRRRFTVIYRGSYLPLTIVYPTNLVDVAIVAEDEKDGLYAAGSKVTLTATAKNGGAFVRWFGDVGDNDAASATLTLTIDDVWTVLPFLKTDWTLEGAAVADGYWTVPVGVSGANLTIKANPTRISKLLTVIDFDKPVAGGSQFTALADAPSEAAMFGNILTEVWFPDSMTSIGANAFLYATMLKNVRVGPNVTTVRKHAFKECSSLKGFNGTGDVILDKLTMIGKSAFAFCSSLSGKVVIGGDATVSFQDSGSGDGLFESCTHIREGVLGDGVSNAGPYPFGICSAMTNLVIGSSMTQIPQRIARGCGKLETVTIRGDVTAIGGGAFAECWALKTINGSGDLDFPHLTSIGRAAFYGVAMTGRAVLGDAVTTYVDEGGIPDGLFESPKFAEIVIGDGLATLGTSYPFAFCSRMTNLVLGAQITVLVDRFARGCTALKSVTAKGEITSIANGSFVDCTALSSWNGTPDLIFPSLTKLGKAAFGNTKFSGRAVIGGRQTCGTEGSTIGTGAFQSVPLGEVVIGDGVTDLSDYPFGYCSSLTNLVVGEGFNNFSDRFLRNCDALRTLHLKRLPATMHVDAFKEVDAKGFRMLVPRTAEWAEFAAKYVTPWKGDPCVSAADKAAYFARFGAGTPKPVGLIAAATTDDVRTLPKNQWFAYEPIGTMLLVR